MEVLKQKPEYIKTSTLECFEEIKGKKIISDLVDFHSINKYLFMTYSPSILKELGRIIANKDKKANSVLFQSYEIVLNNLFSQNATNKNRINTVMHIFGYFKNNLTTQEKKLFLVKIENMSTNEELYNEVLEDLFLLAKRLDKNYILKQTIFNFNK